MARSQLSVGFHSVSIPWLEGDVYRFCGPSRHAVVLHGLNRRRQPHWVSLIVLSADFRTSLLLRPALLTRSLSADTRATGSEPFRSCLGFSRLLAFSGASRIQRGESSLIQYKSTEITTSLAICVIALPSPLFSYSYASPKRKKHAFRKYYRRNLKTNFRCIIFSR